jgi:methylated-DNA-[protein]-cysteine S-methyltransferase
MPPFTLFDTALGACAIAWGERGVVGVRLPARNAAATRAQVRRRHPGAQESLSPPSIARAIEAIVALLGGEARDLSEVVLDMDGIGDFERRVYDLARSIAPGRTLSYGEMAERLGDVHLARDVGQALGRNPFPIIVPCHRVLARAGKAGGFSAPGGVTTKLRMLTIERARTGADPDLFGGALGFAIRPSTGRGAG